MFHYFMRKKRKQSKPKTNTDTRTQKKTTPQQLNHFYFLVDTPQTLVVF